MRNKYYNKKCVYKGIEFDSKKERDHYIILEQLEKTGQIKELKLQVKFELQPKFIINGKVIRPITYIADFTYLDKDNKLVVVDTKGFRTEVYKLKKKMFEYQYKIEIKEV